MPSLFHRSGAQAGDLQGPGADDAQAVVASVVAQEPVDLVNGTKKPYDPWHANALVATIASSRKSRILRGRRLVKVAEREKQKSRGEKQTHMFDWTKPCMYK